MTAAGFLPAADATRVPHWSRFVRVDFETNCWIWIGGHNGRGYGRLNFPRSSSPRGAYAHRVFYETLVGAIPAGMQLDHLCRTRSCVNPDHLEPVTGAENMRRAALLRTRCPAGHPYDERNTYRSTSGRKCRSCHATAERVRRRRIAA